MRAVIAPEYAAIHGRFCEAKCSLLGKKLAQNRRFLGVQWAREEVAPLSPHVDRGAEPRFPEGLVLGAGIVDAAQWVVVATKKMQSQSLTISLTKYHRHLKNYLISTCH